MNDIEGLTKEWLQTGDNAILDVLKAGDEDFINRAIRPRVRSLKEETTVPLWSFLFSFVLSASDDDIHHSGSEGRRGERTRKTMDAERTG